MIDAMYSALMKELDIGKHHDECAYRCLNRECGGDHWCNVCAEDRDPIEVYGTPEHEAWLVEMERRDDYQ